MVDIVRQQKLTVNIQGKEYVKVEGWTSLAAMLGVFAHTEYSRRLERKDEIAYEARVSIKTLDGTEISSGEAICTSTESNKKGQPEYAIKSMAITRATGKACRLAFSWIMALAGFEPTPAEEMDAIEIEEQQKSQPQPKTEKPKKESAKQTKTEVDIETPFD